MAMLRPTGHGSSTILGRLPVSRLVGQSGQGLATGDDLEMVTPDLAGPIVQRRFKENGNRGRLGPPIKRAAPSLIHILSVPSSVSTVVFLAGSNECRVPTASD
jgi:hypothetical protein